MSRFRILGLGAHPDDLEFGCGGLMLIEASKESALDWVVLTRGESSSSGTPEERKAEAQAAADMAGADLHWLLVGEDAKLEPSTANVLILASKIRSLQPHVLLAPCHQPNQHPDHVAAAQLARKAARLARYGGVKELQGKPHAVDSVYYYVVSGAEPQNYETKIVFDISPVRDQWVEMMRCHQTQLRTRDYVEYQLAKAKTLGMEAGVSYAQALYGEDPLLAADVETVSRTARRF